MAVNDASRDGAPAVACGASARHWCFLGFISVAAAMDAVNSTVLILARGHIMGGIHATPDEVAWVNIAYLAAKLTAFPMAAWLTSRARSSVLILGAVALLLVSALGCAATSELAILIAWRVVQGAAGAVLLVAGQAVLFACFPRSRQGIVQAVFAFGAIMAPMTLSPALQGWTVDALSWSWIFLANLPLALAGILAGLAVPAGQPAPIPRGRFDWAGLALLGIAMTCLVFVTQEGSRHNWLDEAEILEAAAIGAVAAALFLLLQVARKRGALVDAAVFRDEHFCFGFLVSFIAGAALFGSAFIIPAFATGALGLTPTEAGLLLLPSGALICLGLLIAGGLIQVKGVDPAKPIPAGIFCFMAAMWMLSGSTSGSGLTEMMPALLLRGLGLGLLFVSLTIVTLRDLPPEVAPHGVALFNFGRQLGGQVGVAALMTYLDHQNALNRNVLSQNLAAGNPALAARQEMLVGLLSDRGYGPEMAASASVDLIRAGFARQVATLSFNECFMAVALLFAMAAPVIIAAKVILRQIHHGRR